MTSQNKPKWKTALPGFFAFILLLMILLYPKDSYQAALSGLEVFLRSVFPALLPFFIASEIMIGLGVVDFLSVLLDPIMYPLFRCSGSSSFIWVMSMTSGYPAGARLAGVFHREKKIKTFEAQRILSFSSTSGPLFMMGAVAIGMLGSPQGGTVILASHYMAAVLLGLIFRFYHSNDIKNHQSKITIQKALTALSDAREKDGRSFGALMGDAVHNSVSVLLVVGGFIMLFSVIINLFMKVGLLDYVTIFLSIFTKPLKLDPALLRSIIGGLFEVTTGCKLVSDTAVSLQEKIAAVSFLIGWSGFSIHSQAASMLSGTGVKIPVYLMGKLLHGLLAALLSYPFTLLLFPEAAEVFNPVKPGIMSWSQSFAASLYLLGIGTVFIFILAAVTYLYRRVLKKAV